MEYKLYDKNYIMSDRLNKFVGHKIRCIPLNDDSKIIYGLLIQIKRNELFSKYKLLLKLYDGRLIEIKPIKYNVFLFESSLFGFIDLFN